jgi:hypothetical protein
MLEALDALEHSVLEGPDDTTIIRARSRVLDAAGFMVSEGNRPGTSTP